MRQYELMIILDPDLEERTIQPSLDKFLSVVTKDNGTVDNVDLWGNAVWPTTSRRSPRASTPSSPSALESATAKELDRQLGLNESILRTKLLRPGA